MRRGEEITTLAVSALTILVDYEGREELYCLGHFTRGHETHGRLRAGEVLLVVNDTTPDGRTELGIPRCGCRAMIWRE